MTPASKGDPVTKRAQISRAALETAITKVVRSSDPQCSCFVGIIVARKVPASRIAANWNVKGIKYGKARRDLCDATISVIIDPMQLELDISELIKNYTGLRGPLIPRPDIPAAGTNCRSGPDYVLRPA